MERLCLLNLEIYFILGFVLFDLSVQRSKVQVNHRFVEDNINPYYLSSYMIKKLFM